MLARECSDVPKLAEDAGEVNDVEINKRCDYEMRGLSQTWTYFFISGEGRVARELSAIVLLRFQLDIQPLVRRQ